MSKELDYITELERKNRLLGERCNQLLKDKGDLTDQIADIKANCDLAIEGRDVKIMELEKENAELKKKIGIYQKGMYDEIEKRDKKLTKAKEIIRTFLNMPMPNNEEVFADVGMFLTKAEQFLKEIEK